MSIIYPIPKRKRDPLGRGSQRAWKNHFECFHSRDTILRNLSRKGENQMRIYRKKLLLMACISLTALTFLGGTAIAAKKTKKAAKEPVATPSVSASAVAKVNGASITRGELDRAMKVMLAQTGGSSTLPADQKKAAETAVLNQLVSAELLYQAGRKLEVKDIEKKVEAQINSAKAKFPSPSQFEKSLRENGISENDLKEYARKEIYINNLIETQIASKVSVSDDEVKKFYDENPEKFKIPESVRASHILIGADAKTTDADKKKAKEKAEVVLNKVKGGEDFAAAAKENSTCPSSAQGGDLGFFTKGQMVPAFESVAFTLKPGEISDVVETQYGYHIIKVIEKQPAKSVTYDEAKKKIQDFLRGQKIRQDITAYVEKLRKEGKVEIPAS
jgi:peptidyl-prolyl cis-trans isomerase C